MKRFGVALGLSFVALGCASKRVDPMLEAQRLTPLEPPPERAVVTAAPTTAPVTLPGDPESDAVIAQALRRVSRARELPIRKAVHGRKLGREDLLTQLKKKSAEDTPPGVVRLQGEAYRALELIPSSYDFEDGLFKLLQSQIAGYYDSDDKTMYLLDDLSQSLEDETLNHELVHALQDQSFNLTPIMKYRDGKGDEIAAAQTLIEGDATSGMLDASGTSALDVDEDALEEGFSTATQFSLVGIATPSFIRASLISPYVDGFRFVNALRRIDGWTGVDDAFRSLPTTTEQVLHIDKYMAHEPALDVPAPSITALGADYKAGFVDSLGEISLRYMLEDEGKKDVADEAAAGWGGDRFVVAERVDSADEHRYAFAAHLRMDTQRDADELAKFFGASLVPGSTTRGCRERADLGPIAWTSKGLDLAIVAGPYRAKRRLMGPVYTSLSTCAAAKAWAETVVAE